MNERNLVVTIKRERQRSDGGCVDGKGSVTVIVGCDYECLGACWFLQESSTMSWPCESHQSERDT
jgi:hypothetical protein